MTTDAEMHPHDVLCTTIWQARAILVVIANTYDDDATGSNGFMVPDTYLRDAILAITDLLDRAATGVDRLLTS